MGIVKKKEIARRERVETEENTYYETAKKARVVKLNYTTMKGSRRWFLMIRDKKMNKTRNEGETARRKG